MESHPSLMIARSGLRSFGMSRDSKRTACEAVRRCERASIFEIALLVSLRGIHSPSSPDAFPATLYRARVSFLRRCGDLRWAIRGFREGGCGFPGECDVPARIVGATAGRFGFRPRSLRKSFAARAAKPGGAQFSRLGAARAERSGFRDCTFPGGTAMEA